MKNEKTFSEVELLEKHMETTDKKLTVKKFNHKKRLVIKHTDGTTIKINNFLLEKVKFSSKTINKGKPEPVFIVYAEHFDPFYVMRSDLRKEPVIKPLKK